MGCGHSSVTRRRKLNTSLQTIETTESLTVEQPELNHAHRRTAKWDMENVFKNYFVLVGTQIGGALFSFATVWLATKLYGTEGYGNIVAIVAGSQAVQLFTNWTNVALARYGVQEFVETGKISKSFWARSAVAIPNLGVVASTAPLWIYWIFAMLHLPSSVLWYVVLHVCASVAWLHFQHALQAAKLPRMQGALLFIERAAVFLLVVLFGYFLKLSWLFAFVAFIAAPLAMCVVAIVKLRPFINYKVAIEKKSVKRILSFSIPLIPYSVAGFFCTNYLDAFFITRYLSKSDLGLYSVAYQINSLLLQFLILVGTLLMPMFVTLRTKEQHGYIHQYVENILPVVTLCWGAVMPFAAIAVGHIVPLIFGQEFVHLDAVLWVFMSGTSFILPSLIGYSPFATAASAVYISFPLALTSAATNVLGNFALIPKWGLLGSAWSTSLSSIVALISIVLLIRLKFRFKTSLLFQCLIPTIFCLLIYLVSGNQWIASTASLLLASVFALMNFGKIKAAISTLHKLVLLRAQ